MSIIIITSTSSTVMFIIVDMISTSSWSSNINDNSVNNNDHNQ